ncbi:hypothetical protein HDZ31DRAFT_28808 [Schizophyllum fasciatum]
MGWKSPGQLDTGIIESRLMMQGALTEDGWAAFRKSAPQGSKHRHDIWLGMEDTLRAIVFAAEDRLPTRFSRNRRVANFECRYNGEAYLDAGHPERVFIDGFTILRDAGPRGTKPGSATDKRVYSSYDRRRGPVYAADIGVTMHWDAVLDEHTRKRNYHSTLAAASYILFNDRRRAFHIAITIEDTSARLWFHCRSHTVCSASFDINKSYTDFIQFVLFAAYASRMQMGFDPSVSRVVDAEGRLQYQFNVRHTNEDNKRTYQTISILHEAAATAQLHYRAMVVYLVRPATKGDGLSIVGNSTHRVLRDFFQRFDQSDELVTRDRILGKMKRMARNAREIEICESFFVTVLADGDVPFDFCWCSPFPDRPLDVVPRNRRRTIYGEVCQDLYSVKNPRLYFFAMGECAKIMTFMLRASTVHEDISPGNFLVHCRPGQLASPTNEDLSECYSVKITDFEYSKDYDEISPNDLRAGTDYYMSVEVQAGEHLFYDDDAPDTLLARYHFSYNPYHDAESVVWMALDFALMHVSAEVVRGTDPQVLSQWLWWQTQYRHRIFVNERGSREREELMLGSHLQLARVELILKRAYGAMSPMLDLVDLVVAMGNAHRMVQSSQEDPDVVADPYLDDVPFKQLALENFDGAIYCEMQETFLEICEGFSGEDDEVVSLVTLLDRIDKPEDPSRLWHELDVDLDEGVPESDGDTDSLGDMMSRADSEELTEGTLLRVIVSEASGVDVDDGEEVPSMAGVPSQPPAIVSIQEESIATSSADRTPQVASQDHSAQRPPHRLTVQADGARQSSLASKRSRSVLRSNAHQTSDRQNNKENEPAAPSGEVSVADNKKALPPRLRTKSDVHPAWR